MTELLYKDESYKIIGTCMEVLNQFGNGFDEIVYADALEIKIIDNGIKYFREQKYAINYKGNVLPHKYKADFIINDKIVLEMKAIDCLVSAHTNQTLNYLGVSKLKLGLLINFGEDSLKYKRIL